MDKTSNKILKNLNNKKFVFITGNGGSGKTTAAYNLKSKLESLGKIVNVISMDDFLTENKLRDNVLQEFEADGKKHSYRYSACCKESYFLRGLIATLVNLNNKNNSLVINKKGEQITLFGNADLHIVEGIGTVFIPNEEYNIEALKVWLECDRETILKHRNIRDLEYFKSGIEKHHDERTLQYVANIEVHKPEFDLIIDVSQKK